jgi:hypothetical protein
MTTNRSSHRTTTRRSPSRREALAAIRERLQRCPGGLESKLQPELGQIRFLRLAGRGIRRTTWCLAGLAMKVVRRFDARLAGITDRRATATDRGAGTVRR